MKNSSLLRGAALTAALVLTFGPEARAQFGFPIDECGTIVADAACGRVFQADSGGFFLVANLDGGFSTWSVGTRVRVVGEINPACDTFCTNPTACILPGSVELCGDLPASFCDGDGGDFQGCGTCPCDNDAPAGTNGGCLNGAGLSARLDASGTASASADTLRFEVTGGNANTFGVLASGDDRLPSNPANPCPTGSGVLSTVMDGLRCVGGNFFRHGSRATDANGDIGSTNAGWGGADAPAGGLVAQGAFVAGQTRNFQVFYRETATLGCQTGQNTTNAIAVPVVP